MCARGPANRPHGETIGHRGPSVPVPNCFSERSVRLSCNACNAELSWLLHEYKQDLIAIRIMERRSILIAAPPASAFDLSCWKAFLHSSCGGSWRPDEILRIEDGNRQNILAAVNSSKGVDYCFVVAIGRGETAKRDRPWRETHLIVGNNSQITERELNNGSPRCFLLFDCCVAKTPPDRVPAEPPEIGQDSRASRKAYDDALMAAEGGLTKLIATNPATNAQSGPVSRHLIREAIDWTSDRGGTLFLPEAVKRTVEMTEDLGAPWKIEYLPGRRLRHFPFAVSP